MSRVLARSSTLVFLLLLAGLMGCPGGPVDADGGTDGGDPDDDAGPSLDAGPSDAGPAADAGPTSDGGPDAGEDGGPESCVPVDPCAGVAVTAPVAFDVAGADAIFGPAASPSLVVGQALRSDVEAALGAPAVSENPFRGWYCASGVRVEYVDDKVGAAFEGNGSAGDIVARVVTLPGVQLTSSNGVEPGIPRADAQAALSPAVSKDLQVGAFDASADEGMSFVSGEDGLVTTVALYKPQAQAAWDWAVDVANAAIGTAPARIARGNNLATADAALGTAYDAEGIVVVSAGFIDLDFLVRIYAGFGVRIAARCPLSGACNAGNATVEQIILSPPFVGEAASGVMLGVLEAEVVSAYGTGTASSESEDLVRYTGTGGRALGVVYVADAACDRRAAALLLNYTDPG